MEELFLDEIVSAVNGELFYNNNNKIIINSISTNSKQIGNNTLFVPIEGENFDGHDFIDDAFANGAIGALTAKPEKIPKLDKSKLYIKVKDTKLALQQLAAYYRKKFNISVIGITGSVGKTSTKEMIATVLSSKFNVHKTKKNFNGQIGLPLSIFDINYDNSVSILEMGVSEFGEMDQLSQMAMPTHAVITNIGVTHIENFHLKDNIFKEKFKITNTLTNGSILFVNGDDGILSKLQNKYKFNIISYGIDNDCKFTAKNITFKENTTEFDLLYEDKFVHLKIPVIGKHNVYNALVAIATGYNMGLNFDEIQAGLLNYKNLDMRQNIYKLNKITLIDDTYNANPDSMRSAIEVLNQISEFNNRKIAVLADMLELGEISEKSHYDIGAFAAENNIDVLITVGKEAKFIAEGAKSANSKIEVYSFSSNNDAWNTLQKLINTGDVILVKGSRGMHMEIISKKIIDVFSKKLS